MIGAELVLPVLMTNSGKHRAVLAREFADVGHPDGIQQGLAMSLISPAASFTPETFDNDS
ncbi:hypothetical protein [Niveibacterium microcysteis]|uniref:Uncharacterized protein n=1 Tax=Niveibacterium microcysteis TaxID=2811415 RepID=A0ABX7M336_9RHOO|nr:hypothetical protein [Niveibacterium microcysteis]QSI76170.1 hypothetical protein JY500_17085 [Niveibacterium microcysteis]